MNCKLPDAQAGFRKGRGTRDHIAKIQWIIKRARELQEEKSTSALLCSNLCVEHNKLENSSRDGNTRPPDLPPEKSVCRSRSNRIRPETIDWLPIGKGIHHGCILSPCLFNLYSENIIRKARLHESQTGIKIARGNINNIIYADDTTLMAESEEELKSLWMKVKEESEKAGLKLNIQKTKIMTSSLITSWQIDGETVETVTDFIFLGSKITSDSDCSHEIKSYLLLGKKATSKLDSILKKQQQLLLGAYN